MAWIRRVFATRNFGALRWEDVMCPALSLKTLHATGVSRYQFSHFNGGSGSKVGASSAGHPLLPTLPLPRVTPRRALLTLPGR